MQARLFAADTVPEFTTAAWYAGREAAPHLEEPLHQDRLWITRRMVDTAITDDPNLRTLIDLGCGDGGFLSTIRGLPLTAWGFDLQPSNVAAAHVRGVDVRFGDFLDSANLDADIIVATEVLEHLLDPHGLVRHLHTTTAATVIASSPATETREAHYAFHAWAFDLAGYAALFTDVGWTIAEHETTGMFQILRAVR